MGERIIFLFLSCRSDIRFLRFLLVFELAWKVHLAEGASYCSAQVALVFSLRKTPSWTECTETIAKLSSAKRLMGKLGKKFFLSECVEIDWMMFWSPIFSPEISRSIS